MEITEKQIPGGELSLKDLVYTIREWGSYLWMQWKIIVFFAFLGGGIGFIYASMQKAVYTATLSFVVEGEQSNGGLGSALGLAGQFGLDLGGDASGVFSGGNLIEFMKSRSNLEKALLSTVVVNGKRQTLAEQYITVYRHRESWEKNKNLNNLQFLPGSDRSSFTREQDSLLGVFHKNLTSSNLTVDKTDKKLNIITVKVNSIDELFSKNFAEIMVQVVSDFYIDTKTKKSVQNLAILQHQADSVRRALNSALTGVAASNDYNPNPNPALQILRVPSQRRQVDVQANQAILTELVKNLEVSKLTLRKETPLIQIIDKPILPLAKSRMSRIVTGLMGFIFAGVLCSLFFIGLRFFKNLKSL